MNLAGAAAPALKPASACKWIVFEGQIAKAIEVTVSCCIFCLGYHFVSENSSRDPVWFCQPLGWLLMESVALCLTLFIGSSYVSSPRKWLV